MLPFGTTTSLLPHQGDAVAKVLPSRVSGLFMEMGTGKTRTSIELAKIRAHRIDRVVWCCPVSLKETIRQEILRWKESQLSHWLPRLDDGDLYLDFHHR